MKGKEGGRGKGREGESGIPSGRENNFRSAAGKWGEECGLRDHDDARLRRIAGTGGPIRRDYGAPSAAIAMESGDYRNKSGRKSGRARHLLATKNHRISCLI